MSIPRKTALAAATWFKRAVGVLRHARGESESAGWLVGYEAENLLRVVLFEAELLIDVLNDDCDFDTLRRYAADISRALRHRELEPKLRNTSGRTVAEAAAFESKARELSIRGGAS